MKTWPEVVEELAGFIDGDTGCERCPATKYCDAHADTLCLTDHGCYQAIMGWAKEETGEQ